MRTLGVILTLGNLSSVGEVPPLRELGSRLAGVHDNHRSSLLPDHPSTLAVSEETPVNCCLFISFTALRYVPPYGHLLWGVGEATFSSWCW